MVIACDVGLPTGEAGGPVPDSSVTYHAARMIEQSSDTFTCCKALYWILWGMTEYSPQSPCKRRKLGFSVRDVLF